MGKEGTGGPNCAGPSKEKTPEEERLPVVLKALSGRFECRFSSAFPIGAGLLVIRVMEPTRLLFLVHCARGYNRLESGSLIAVGAGGRRLSASRFLRGACSDETPGSRAQRQPGPL